MSQIPIRVVAALGKVLRSHIAFRGALIFQLEIELLAKSGDERLNAIYSQFEEATQLLGQSARSYLRSNTFFSVVSALELFLQELVQSVIAEYPKKVGITQFTLSDILDAASPDELLIKAGDLYLNKVMYKKPVEYLRDITDLLSVDRTALADVWPIFVEAKARRDVGIHNEWICNGTYVRKVQEVGIEVPRVGGHVC